MEYYGLKPYSLAWFENLRGLLVEELYFRDWGAQDFASYHNVPPLYVVRLKARIYKGIPREEADKLHNLLTKKS